MCSTQSKLDVKDHLSMKMELLYDGNETVLNLTGRQMQSIQRFNRFVVNVYIQSWFTSRSAPDAPVNDIHPIQRLKSYDDSDLRNVRLKMMLRHSWYLSPELATLAVFSKQVPDEEKSDLISNRLLNENFFHLLQTLPSTVSQLKISRSFFMTSGIYDSFLEIPVCEWHQSKCYTSAVNKVKNIPCVMTLLRGALHSYRHLMQQRRMRLKSSTCCKSLSSIGDSFPPAIGTVL